MPADILDNARLVAEIGFCSAVQSRTGLGRPQSTGLGDERAISAPRIRGSVNRRVAYVSRSGRKAVESL
jgi:hypothetical protein